MSASTETRARLRPIDPRPVTQDGQPCYLLRDPLQLSDHMLVVPGVLAAALALCDGTRSPEEIGAAFVFRYGQRLPARTILQLLTALDEALLLDNARSANACAAALEDYRRAPFRAPSCAGQTYPADPADLRRTLNTCLENTDGASSGAVAWRGLVSPHIDYQRGGHVYAEVWKRCAAIANDIDLAIVIGTDHYGDDPFTLTRQHYATPYGVLPTAPLIVDGLAEALGARQAYAGELRHRVEHSLELPLVWLHHLRHGRPCEIVPVLCGSMARFSQNGRGPAEDPAISAFLAAMQRLTAGRRVMVVASGDLAHVGPAFGGAPLDEKGRADILAADQALLAHIGVGDAEAFHESIRSVDNRNNVCGVGQVYLTLRLLEHTHGHIAGYDHCPADEDGTSIVSVCGLVLE